MVIELKNSMIMSNVSNTSKKRVGEFLRAEVFEFLVVTDLVIDIESLAAVGDGHCSLPELEMGKEDFCGVRRVTSLVFTDGEKLFVEPGELECRQRQIEKSECWVRC